MAPDCSSASTSDARVAAGRVQPCGDDRGTRRRRAAARAAAVLLLAAALCAGGAGAATADLERGRGLFKRNCAGCHGPDGRGGAHTFMPHVNTLTRKGYIETVEDEYLALVIAEGGAAVGKSGYMPSWKSKLSREEITDIIAYIRSLAKY